MASVPLGAASSTLEHLCHHNYDTSGLNLDIDGHNGEIVPGTIKRYSQFTSVTVFITRLHLLVIDWPKSHGAQRSGVGCHKLPHDDVIKWKHFPRYWPFVGGIRRSSADSPHRGQWRGALMFSMICTWTNAWVNNREAGNLRRHRAHYDVTVMIQKSCSLKLDVSSG